ncbi:uracil phosphoribosyltransferase [Pseudoxanthomonas sp. GM95]|uniref:uracil phosphoribosyltransferase n=1 Tax=Pseudoxanthomonas sp. GM95 TaxID=1881043 RepID=UPI0008CA5F4D|nr:uracil phosphoribosyltransferase [Pseudoxanthomonas sp. GM95]SEL68115.1 uracil phosphoribosyltransferase [Pseudoxanthomonas sp. GM95]
MIEVVQHPLVQHKLTLLRRSKTSTTEFRRLVGEIGALLAYEACRDLPLAATTITTSSGVIRSPLLTGKKLCLVSITHAGNRLIDGMLEVIPAARVGYLGLHHHAGMDDVVEYDCRLPEDIALRQAIVVDPIIATGQTAVAALRRIKAAGTRELKFICLLAAQDGLEALTTAHPDVAIHLAGIEPRTDGEAAHMHGLGDAGERMFGVH